MKKIIVLFILILPLTLWAQKQEFAIVDRVIDGDTIVLLDSSQTRVRFIGVDTPETKHPRKPIEFYGLESSAYTTKQLSSQKILLVYDSTKKYDRYGRLLAYVHILDADTTDFCRLLIELGYGRAYTKLKHSRLSSYIQTEVEAKEKWLGLWSENAPEPIGPPTPTTPTE